MQDGMEWHERLSRARRIGRVFERKGKGRNGKPRTGYMLVFPASITPRYLYSAKGSGFPTREAAQAALDAIHHRIAGGETAQQAVSYFAPERSKTHTVGSYIDLYIEAQEVRERDGDISPNHLRELRRCQKRSWTWWRRMELSDLHSGKLVEYRDHLKKQRLSGKSIKNDLGYFRAFLSFLLERRYIDQVPPMPAVKLKKHKPTLLAADVQRAILDAITWDLRGAFLAACHGVRPGELRALDLENVQPSESGRPAEPVNDFGTRRSRI